MNDRTLYRTKITIGEAAERRTLQTDTNHRSSLTTQHAFHGFVFLFHLPLFYPVSKLNRTIPGSPSPSANHRNCDPKPSMQSNNKKQKPFETIIMLNTFISQMLHTFHTCKFKDSTPSKTESTNFKLFLRLFRTAYPASHF